MVFYHFVILSFFTVGISSVVIGFYIIGFKFDCFGMVFYRFVIFSFLALLESPLK